MTLLPKFEAYPQTVANAETSTGSTIIYAVLLNGGTTATSLTFADTTASATRFIVVAPFTDSDASAAASMYFDFTSIGGIEISGGCTLTLAGTGAAAYLWSNKAFAA